MPGERVMNQDGDWVTPRVGILHAGDDAAGQVPPAESARAGLLGTGASASSLADSYSGPERDDRRLNALAVANAGEGGRLPLEVAALLTSPGTGGAPAAETMTDEAASDSSRDSTGNNSNIAVSGADDSDTEESSSWFSCIPCCGR